MTGKETMAVFRPMEAAQAGALNPADRPASGDSNRDRTDVSQVCLITADLAARGPIG